MISFIVPTIGRPSLVETLRSIETYERDEIIVVGTIRETGDPRPRYVPVPPGHNWGCLERTIGMSMARGQYLAFLDDDDVYAPGARAAMEDAILETPGRPVLFRMVYPNGHILWDLPILQVAHVSTQMILIPNDPDKLGTWTSRREGDFDFLDSMAWPTSAIVWRREVIAQLGHNEAYAG